MTPSSRLLHRTRRAVSHGAAAARAVSGHPAVAMILPFVSNDYWALIGTRAAIYWVSVSGLNLVALPVIGHRLCRAVDARGHTTSVLVAGNVMAPDGFCRLAGRRLRRGGVRRHCRPAGLAIPHLLFPMSTLGFATIVTQIALAWQSVTGGGIGIAGPNFQAFNTAWGFTVLHGIAAVSTWMSANVAHSRFGRALIASAMPSWRRKPPAFPIGAC